MDLFQLLDSVAKELPGCLCTSIVNQETGLQLVSVAMIDSDDAAASDAFHSNLYRNAGAAIHELGSLQAVDGIVIEGEEAVYISMMLPNTQFFWHVVVEAGTTLGFTQALMRKHRNAVREGVHELFA